MRFEVPGILVGGPSPHEQQDDPFGAAKGPGSQFVPPGGLPQQMGQAQPPGSEGPNLESGPPGESITKPDSGAGMVEAEHRAEGSEEGGTGGAGGIVVTAAFNISKTADL